MNTRIAIIGGGVAAYTAVETLRRSAVAREIKIIWIAPKPSLVYKPYFFDALSGYRQISEYTFPLTGYHQKFHIDFFASTVDRFDYANNALHLSSDRTVYYEYALLASGQHTSVPEQIQSEYTVDAHDIATLLQHLEAQFLLAKEQLSLLRKPFLSFVIEGRTITSVVTLFAIYNYTEFLRKKYDFRRNEISITYISAEKQFGGDVPLKLTDMLEQYARDHGIDIQLHATIRSFEQGRLVLGNGAVLDTHTFVTGGVPELDPLYAQAGLSADQFGGLAVNTYLQLPEVFNVYACGSLINYYDPHKKERTWDSFPVAEQQAKIAANNIVAEIRGRNKQMYQPKTAVEFIPVSDQLCIGMYGDQIYFNNIMQKSRVFLAKKYMWQLVMPD